MRKLPEVMLDPQSAPTLDSSKLRSTALAKLKDAGLVRITRYNETAAFLVSPAAIEDMTEKIVGRAGFAEQARDSAPLMTLALSLGVAPGAAFDVLFSGDAGVDPTALIRLLAERAEELDIAAVVADRAGSLSEPTTSLDDFAAELGIDLEVLSQDMAAGRYRAHVSVEA
ncbi:MAG TPA: hypothetical protein VK662_05935 [Acidothermaceae bacterium]|nr:hypothetical protein [Acidothermaceae bacterium]